MDELRTGNYLIANFEPNGERFVGDATVPPGSVGTEFVVLLPPGVRAPTWFLLKLDDGKYRLSRGPGGFPAGILGEDEVGWMVTPEFPGEHWIITPRIKSEKGVGYSIESSTGAPGKAWTANSVVDAPGTEKITLKTLPHIPSPPFTQLFTFIPANLGTAQ
ncbi:hypothetical protein K474DRAFT_1712079 [Panus rudis PR-1116 ss-1]|nr:hypothetical protein K474DRAFT_1712079 [Panus rudis PR-1116 ss-1]